MSNFVKSFNLDHSGWVDKTPQGNPACLYFPHSGKHWYNKGKIIDTNVFLYMGEKSVGSSESNEELKTAKYKLYRGEVLNFNETVARAKSNGKHRCYCPFHADSNDSAFFKISENSRKGDFFFYCTACSEQKFYKL